MDDVVEFDPALAGFWPVGRVAAYEADDEQLREAVRAMALETKSEAARRISPVAEMQGLLNEMTAELRAQFELFRTIRERAEPGMDGEEGEAKLAKADGKAAVDSTALIVRTLEKIDAMQRGLVDALAREAEESFDDAAYRALLRDIERRINERAEERAHRLLEEWTAGATGGAGPPGENGQGTGNADAAAGGGEV